MVYELKLVPPAWLTYVQPVCLEDARCPMIIVPVTLIDQSVASLHLASVIGSACSSESKAEGLCGAGAGSCGWCAPVVEHRRMGWGKGALAVGEAAVWTATAC